MTGGGGARPRLPVHDASVLCRAARQARDDVGAPLGEHRRARAAGDVPHHLLVQGEGDGQDCHQQRVHGIGCAQCQAMREHVYMVSAPHM